MSAPAYEGEVRLGVPHDIVGPYLPPILRRFDKAWPRVRVALKCTTTPLLRELLRQGSARPHADHRAALRARRRDAAGGRAGLGRRGQRRGAPARSAAGFARRRELRVPPLRAEGAARRRARLAAGVRGLQHGAAARLHRGRPGGRPVPAPHDPRLSEVVGGSRACRGCRSSSINMYLPPVRQSEIAVELARHIRQEFASRFRRQSRPELAMRRPPQADAAARREDARHGRRNRYGQLIANITHPGLAPALVAARRRRRWRPTPASSR